MALYELRLMSERNPSFHHMRCIVKVGDALDVLKVVAHAGTHEEEEHEGGAGVLRDTLTFHSHLSWSLGEPGPALRLH